MTHTPTPWLAVHQVNTDGAWDIVNQGETEYQKGVLVAHLGGSLAGGDTPEADAKFIELAVNCHDELVAALEELVSEADTHGGSVRSVSRYSIDKARAALSKATKAGD